MRRAFRIACAAIILGLAVPAAADPIDDAVSARLNGDYAKALKLLRPLADRGNAAAQSNLGFMYATGMGLPQDRAGAAKWYRLAADQGNAFAQNGLGLMYEKGQGVPQDIVRAHMWFNLSGLQGHERGLKNRDRAGALMTREQVAEVQKLARGWKPAAK